MALVFTDGFDHYVGADTLKKWTGLVASTAIGNVTVRPEWARPPGGMGINIADASVPRGIYKTFGATHTSFVAGFAVYFGTSAPSSATAPMIAFYDSASGISTTYQLCLRTDAGGHLVIATGGSAGTVLATSTNTFSADTWYHVEIKATINNTTGTYEVKVNGSSTNWIPAATGKNTRGQSANNYIDVVALETCGLTTTRFDDFYFLSSASPNNDFLGPVKVQTAFPSGAGNYAQWSGNYASNFTNVQELAGDGDSTFNQSATAAQIDTFAFDDMPTGTIYAVQDVLYARQDAGAARTVRTKFRSGPTDYSGTTFSMAGSYQYHLDPRDVDPATSSAYTVSNFNAQERGYELVS
jgi:hypothetical protein